MFRASLLLFLLVGSSFGADLTLPATVSGEPGDFVTVKATTTGAVVKWVSVDKGLKLFPAELLKDSKTAIVLSNTPGTYRLIAYTSDAAGPSEPAISTITISGAVPPPTPPGPPTPGPTPDVAPIPAPGFRVLVLYDTLTVTKLPAAQQQAIFSGNVRDYLNQKTIRGTDMKTPEWRMWDVNIDASNEGQLWQDAVKRPHKSLPWVIISDGTKGFEGPLPANETDFLALLKKYGG